MPARSIQYRRFQASATPGFGISRQQNTWLVPQYPNTATAAALQPCIVQVVQVEVGVPLVVAARLVQEGEQVHLVLMVPVGAKSSERLATK